MNADSAVERGGIVGDVGEHSAVERLVALRQYQDDGRRAPHKPLLVLLALGQLASTGSSNMPWSLVQERLGELLDAYGTSTSSGRNASAYPFTRLRSDGVWQLSRDVPNDKVGPLNAEPIDGHFTAEIEEQLRGSPDELYATARALVLGQFPMTIAPDVLVSVGLDPELVFSAQQGSEVTQGRRRDASWPGRILAAWDRRCAFCGFDGALRGAPVAIEAAHVRWFNAGGPDDLDNGLALCSLHHKLLDRGVIGMRDPGTVWVSDAFSAGGEVGRAVYELHGRELQPRPGTLLPAHEHVAWHRQEVFKGNPLAA